MGYAIIIIGTRNLTYTITYILDWAGRECFYLTINLSLFIISLSVVSSFLVRTAEIQKCLFSAEMCDLIFNSMFELINVWWKS